MNKKDKLILAAFIGCTFIQFWLLARIVDGQRIRPIHWHSDSWHIFNFTLAALAVVVMATVFARGRWWHRLLAPLLCIVPVLIIYDLCRWSLTELSRR